MSLVTLRGVGSNIVIDVKPLHLQKQSFPKLVTELGMVMEVKLLQLPKHQSPKLLIELGIVMDVKLLQS